MFFLKGLRTLELCVDNLQPDFLYDHIQPVRADLMQVRNGGNVFEESFIGCSVRIIGRKEK